MLHELKGSTGSHSGRLRQRRRRAIRNAFIIAVTTALILVAAGFIYSWQVGKQTVVKPVETKQVIKKVIEPVKQADNSPIGASVSIFTSPIKQGANASITVRTKPKAACSIRIEYDKQPSTDSGLMPKNADDFGVVNWTWTVEDSRPVGKWPVEILCALGDKSAYVKADLEIEKL